ncbi:MAG: helix-turn-helix domain-containing protein [Eubacteriales bacterium]|jgi:two-component system response regulator YesN
MNEQQVPGIAMQSRMERLLQQCARFYDATQIPVNCIWSFPKVKKQQGASSNLNIKTIPEWACPLSERYCDECLQRAGATGSNKLHLLMTQGGAALAVIICDEFKLIVGPVFTVSRGQPPASIYASAEGQRLCPEVPTDRFISSITLLCELCTGKPALVEDVVTVEAPFSDLYYESQVIDSSNGSGQLHSGEEYEQRIYELIERGDIDRLEATLGSPSNIAIDIMSPDPVRQQKYLFIAFMTIAVRAAIHGGMPSGLAFEVCRRYSLLMDGSQNIKDIISYTYNLAISLCRGVKRARGSAGYPHLRKCIDFINSHLHEPLNVKQIAQAGGMSIRSLTKYFRSDTGLSPMAFVEMRRVEESKYMLRYSNATIAEIAVSLQFCSQSYFSKVFKKHCNMSPGKYRRTASEFLNITKV